MPFRVPATLSALVLGLLAFLGVPVAQAQGTGHLSVRGQDILDPSGRPIVLRGWNWGHYGSAQPQDAADNAAQGANVVRLPIRWWGLYRKGTEGIESRNDQAPGGIDPRNLKTIDDNIRWVTSQHMWVILFIDSNCGQNGLQNDAMIQYCDPGHKYPDGNNFWTDPDSRRRFIDLWRFIAARYKDTPYIGLFEPLPEPGSDNVSGEQIHQFYGEVMGAIRQAAPGIPFLIGGWKYRPPRVRDVYDPSWKDVVYTGNLFLKEGGPEGDAGGGGGGGGGGRKKAGGGGGGGGGNNGVNGLRNRLQDLLDLRNRNNVPIFVQQAGVKNGEDPDQSQLRQLLGMLNDNRVGFAYWEYRGARNADSYGALFGDERSGWHADQPVLNAISQGFKQPPAR